MTASKLKRADADRVERTRPNPPSHGRATQQPLQRARGPAVGSGIAAEEEGKCHTLIPFDEAEGLKLSEAAGVAGKSARTVRNWCIEHGIGRKVGGGIWVVSKVALAMLLEDDLDALKAYRQGARASWEDVAKYYHRLGLGHLLQLPGFSER